MANQAYLVGGTAKGEVNVGDRRLTGLAAGADDMDGVNVAQLKAVTANSVADAVMYDDSTHNNITLGGDTYDNSTHTGGTTITNVADGAAPSDAVNYSQLSETNTNVTNLGDTVTNLGDTVTNLGDEVDNIYNTGTKYFHANSTGTDSSATGVDAIAIGMGSVADVARSVALGDGAKTLAAVGTSSVTIGGKNYDFAGTAPVGTVSIGDAGEERTLTNVAAGRLSDTSTDAVNGSQLFASNQAIDSITNNFNGLDGRAVKYDLNADGTVNHDRITLEGAPTQITNVKAGELSDTSTDAVNGSQLNATNEQVTNNTTNIANNTTDIATNTTNIANNTVNIDGLKDDALQWDATANGGSGAYSANHMGNGPAKITNVAAGELSDTSTDAVNGSQLKETNDQVTNNTTNIANNLTEITNLGDEVDNIYNTGTKYFHANSTGTDSVASGVDAVAIGMGAIASADGSVALGAGSVADGSTLANQAYLVGGTAKGEVNVGDRRLTGLAAGADDMDGVNVAQLKAVTANSVADAVMYDDSTHNNITLGGDTYDNSTHTGGATITNVADGAAPSDAVNYSQLTETNTNVTNLGDTVTNLGDEVDNIYNTGTKYFHANSTGTDSSATGVDAIAIGMGSVADVARSVALGDGAKTLAAVGTSSATIGGKNYDFAGTAPVGTVSIGDAGEERTLTNVAAGRLSDTSTDAVNGSQLFASNQAIDSITNNFNGLDGRAVKYDLNADGTVNHDRITLEGAPTQITNVKAGELSDTSTDAVNGSQLNATNEQVTNNTTNIANNTTDITNLGDNVDNIYNTGTKYFHANSTGTDSSATGVDAIAIGMGSVADVARSVALGDGAKTAAAVGTSGATILGTDYAFAGTAPVGTVSIGDVGEERTLTNVAAGRLSDTSTDAVNGSQLFASNQAIDSITNNFNGLDGRAVKYDLNADGTVNHDRITLEGAPTQITNVKAGELSDTSTDAVNGSQLNATNEQVTNNTTNIANNTTDIATNTTNIANNTVNIDGLKDDALQWDATANGGSGAYSANHMGNGPAKITNVAAGELSDTSTDAVNGSQLKETNDQVTNNTTNIANNTTDITNLGDNVDNIYNTGTKYFHANSTGTDSSATGVDAIAIGMGSVADVARSVALGDGAKTAAVVGTRGTTIQGTDYAFAGAAPVGTVSIGDVGAERTITNVAAGRLSDTSTDAVNGSQLFASNQAIDSITNNFNGLDGRAVKYDLNADGTVNHDRITLEGAPTQITNVKAGELSATSTDAVNGSQLNATNEQVTTNTTNIATNTTNINGLKDDALQWDATANGGNGAYSANHMGNGPAKITNVAAGDLTSTSTDAVNGSQLKETNDQVTNNTVNINGLKQDALLWDSNLGAFSASHGSVTVNKITNVAAGELSEASKDAVNGSQLFATNTNVTNLDNRVTNIEDTIYNLEPTQVKYLKVNSTAAGSVATGSEAIAMGPNAVASGDDSIASGNGAISSGIGSIAMGSHADASADGSIATGNNAKASGQDSTAMGNGAVSTASNSVALGANSLADRANSVSVGSAGHERQITNVAAGSEDTDAVNVAQLKEISGDVTNVNNAITKISNGTDGMFQVNNTNNLSKPIIVGKNALAGGAGSSASGDNSMAVGMQAKSSGTDSVALGNSSSATARNSVALGTNSVADRDNTVSVGSVGGERQIANVAAGTKGTDAVNVSQLNDGINSSYQYTDNKFDSLKNMVEDNKNKMSAGVAGAMAMASLPQPYSPGASMVSMGGGTFQSQSAVALGVSAISDNGKWVTKVAGTTNSQGDFGASLGVGYQW
ncbi:Adhesin yadA precursor [Serratia fonticola]|nr:Adhesin yadA precursor [Serratia fonticola]